MRTTGDDSSGGGERSHVPEEHEPGRDGRDREFESQPRTVAQPLAGRLRGDEADLFLAYHRQLVKNVGYRVNTSPDVVEDACAFAWVQFMRLQPDREGAWRSWLVTTAEREAWRLHREQVRDLRVDVVGAGEHEIEPVDQRDGQTLRGDLSHALDLLAAVPERRRRAKALQVMGFTYQEIAELLAISYTRANQLITEANAAINREQSRIGLEQQPRSPRAARLRELEDHTPGWLCAAIGRPPGKTTRAEAVLAWRRAALAIDDYRRAYAPGAQLNPLRDRPADPGASRAYDLALRAADRARSARRIHRDRSIDR